MTVTASKASPSSPTRYAPIGRRSAAAGGASSHDGGAPGPAARPRRAAGRGERDAVGDEHRRNRHPLPSRARER